MALVLSGSIDISGSMTATTILISSPGAAGMVSSSAQITELAPLMAYTASLKGAAIVSSSQQITNYYKFAETASASTKFYGNVTASGNISVGTDSFTSPGGADKFIGVFSGQDSSIILQDSVETWEMYMNDDLYFTTGSTNPKNVMSLRRVTGNVEINEGNLVIGKAGKGIDFSITSNGSGTTSSELLNDYEEGTWTPTLGGGTADPTGVTYAVQTGNYTKVGRLVTINFIMGFTTYTGGTGAVFVRGLPFACAGGDSAFGACQLEQFSFTGGRTYATLRVNSGDSVIDPQQMGASTTWTAFTHGTNITSSGTGKYITGTITYTT